MNWCQVPPNLSTNALAAAEESMNTFATLTAEEDGASVDGRACGVVSLGTGFETGALCPKRNFIEEDTWVLTLEV